MPVSKRGRVYNTQEWRRVCAIVKERDGHRCRECGCIRLPDGRSIPCGFHAAKPVVRLSVQHRIPERVAPHLALALSNLFTLCLPCHGKQDGGRRY